MLISRLDGVRSFREAKRGDERHREANTGIFIHSRRESITLSLPSLFLDLSSRLKRVLVRFAQCVLCFLISDRADEVTKVFHCSKNSKDSDLMSAEKNIELNNPVNITAMKSANNCKQSQSNQTWLLAAHAAETVPAS